MASIDQRHGSWRVRWRDLRGRQRQRTAPTRALAKRLAREIEADLALGRDWRPRVSPRTLAQLVETWLGHRERTCRASTVRLDERRMSVFADFLLEAERLDDQVGPEVLSRGLLDRFYAHLRGPRRNTVRTANATIGGVLSCWRWLADHDEHSEGVPRAPFRYQLPTVPPSRTVAPTWGQVDAMISELRVEHHRRLAVVMRYTGLRVSQALRIRWDDLDLDGAAHGCPTLYVRGELGKTAAESAGRLVPITQHLVNELATWGVREGEVLDHVRESTVTHAWQKAWTRARVPDEVWRRRSTHAVRKAFVSGLKHAGADADAIEAYVGRVTPGERGTYTDPRALPLLELVDLVPAIGSAGTDFAKRRWARGGDGG